MKARMSLVLMTTLALFAGFTAVPAHAVSQYDNLVTLVDSVYLETPPPEANMACDSGLTVDFSTNWLDAIESVTHFSSASDEAKRDAFVEKLRSNMAAGTGWYVKQSYTSGNGYNGTAIRVGIFDPASKQYFRMYNGRTPFMAGLIGQQYMQFTLSQYSSECEMRFETINRTITPSASHYFYPENLLVFAGNITYPEGYEGPEIPSDFTPHYVAMGDSYSSGEGNPPFEIGTDIGGSNECHRSSQAYPRLLQYDASFNIGPTAFIACSGATTSDVLYGDTEDGNWGEGPQIDALSDQTEVVTLTIGGNDVGFKTFATNCATAVCTPGGQAYRHIMDAIEGDLQSNLENTYSVILDNASNAILYVVAYPYMTDNYPADGCSTFGVNDQGARDAVTAINNKVSDAVYTVQMMNPDYTDRIVYVPANSSNNTTVFDGQYICSSPSYFNDLNLSNQEYSFHPNSLGHSAYALLLGAKIS